MPKPRKIAPDFRAALRSWDAENPTWLEWGAERANRRAAFACMWFIENASEDAPDRSDVFFQVREIYRASSAGSPLLPSVAFTHGA